jgi:hypothetical protein
MHLDLEVWIQEIKGGRKVFFLAYQTNLVNPNLNRHKW